MAKTDSLPVEPTPVVLPSPIPPAPVAPLTKVEVALYQKFIGKKPGHPTRVRALLAGLPAKGHELTPEELKAASA